MEVGGGGRCPSVTRTGEGRWHGAVCAAHASSLLGTARL